MKSNKTQSQVYAFKKGDAVCWSSQSGGHAKRKMGVVAEVVPARQSPNPRFNLPNPGLPRDHVSYLVMVGHKPYWPRAAALAPATDVPDALGLSLCGPFDEGDRVTWGEKTVRSGEVVEVVLPGQRPSASRFPVLREKSGLSRKHESYVVMANGRAWWPVASGLRRAV